MSDTPPPDTIAHYRVEIRVAKAASPQQSHPHANGLQRAKQWCEYMARQQELYGQQNQQNLGCAPPLSGMVQQERAQ
jgi:hypothetical protein